MASYTYEQLKDLKVAELREIAKDIEHESLHGYTTMHKEHLLNALCKALGITSHHAAHGAQKVELKAKIRQLRKERDEIAAAGQGKEKLHAIRDQIHTFKHRLRRMAAA